MALNSSLAEMKVGEMTLTLPNPVTTLYIYSVPVQSDFLCMLVLSLYLGVFFWA